MTDAPVSISGMIIARSGAWRMAVTTAAIATTAITATVPVAVTGKETAGKGKHQKQHRGGNGKIFFQLNELHQRKSWMPAFAGMTGCVDLDGIFL